MILDALPELSELNSLLFEMDRCMYERRLACAHAARQTAEGMYPSLGRPLGPEVFALSTVVLSPWHLTTALLQ